MSSVGVKGTNLLVFSLQQEEDIHMSFMFSEYQREITEYPGASRLSSLCAIVGLPKVSSGSTLRHRWK